MLKIGSMTALLAVLFVFPLIIRASVAGSLDKLFDADGRVTVSNGSSSLGRGIAVQPDGKIVVVGQSNFDFFVARLNPNGSLDTTFDGDGKVTTDFALGPDDAMSVEILADGKILVSGSANLAATGQDFAIARYNPNGSLDTTFDGDGKATVDFGSLTIESAMNILIQSDGKYVLAGRTISAGQDYAAARLNTNGSLDTSFDTDGKVIVSVTPNNDLMWAAALQQNEKIVIVGSATPGTNTDFGVVRLNTNGSLDTNWDGDGIVTTDFAVNNDQAAGVAVQADGRVVVCGTTSTPTTSSDFACVRYLATGALNLNGFGTNGKVSTNFNGTSSDSVSDVVLQADGRIVVLGQTDQNGTVDFALVRYTADGVLDPSFDGDGRVITDFAANSDLSSEGVLQADGKLLVVGSANTGSSIVGVARYHLRTFNIPFDFDGDDSSEVGIFRPPVGEWWYSRSSDNQVLAAQFGTSGDKLVPGDFTGDGKADIAFFRAPTGFWFVLRSEDGSFFSFPFGTSGDVPVPADYDGDGKTDPAVFRPSTVTWFISRSSDGGTTIATFGATGDKPVPADYDGDHKADIAIFRPSVGEWWYSRSSTGQTAALQFGLSTDKPVPGDYTGDGKADVAFFRPSSGVWFILRSEDSSFFSFPFGTSGDTPVPADYDGDGKTDTAVFRPATSTWFLNRTTAGVSIVGFGAGGDTPLPSVFIP
ncbi:MAG: VCBS repeat-containing protein [Acidobacteria bacterium]|nr:VCBS repeat-containing protein [Acidobacteriota bacterium]